MFQIKICGVTTAADALMAAAAGADAIGLNFYPPSPRFVSLAAAREIGAAIDIVKVGVFVNAAVVELHRTIDELQLDYVQLHGDEPPEYLGELAGRKIIRAFRCRDGNLAAVEEYLAKCSAMPAAVLLDAYTPGAYGGTGHVVDWQSLAPYAGTIGGVPLILAGGLRPENVASAIETVHPAAVDTASGVERSPGQKDAAATQAFVAAARRGFGATDGHG